MKWIEKTNIDNYLGDITKQAKIEFLIPRYGFDHNKMSSIYVSFKTDSKYKIVEDPKIGNLAKTGKPKFKNILDSVRHKVYRFHETDDPQLIRIIVLIGIPNTVIRWAKVGLATGIIVPLTILLATHFTQKIPDFGFESVAGVIALLIGERVIIFQDIPLMKKWSDVNLGLLLFSVVALLFLTIFSTTVKIEDTCLEQFACDLNLTLEDLKSMITDFSNNEKIDSPMISLEDNLRLSDKNTHNNFTNSYEEQLSNP